jgi:5-hydroxyisourate hydrolase
MSRITTHILDVSLGRPAADVEVILMYEGAEMTRGLTSADGRLGGWDLDSGIYSLRFETKAYFSQQSVDTLYPFVEVHFEVADEDHYHIPLLLSPFGYSTYRGS